MSPGQARWKRSHMQQWQQDLDRNGYVLIPFLSTTEVESILDELTLAFQGPQAAEAMRSREGTVYGARNMIDLWPPVAELWKREPLVGLLRSVLGEAPGLVRCLYFDKPPEQTWALPWHKDLTIAVRDNTLPSTQFCKPTTKAGAPHVEAPVEVLNRMVTVRLHLDPVTEENGPLKVIPGSHRSGKQMELGEVMPWTVMASAGEALVIRPLVTHSSGRSDPKTTSHRRILHLEFAGCHLLPDGYEWHRFLT